MEKILENSSKQENGLFYINNYGYHTIKLRATRQNIVDMIDYALENSSGPVYNYNIQIEQDEWAELRDHWSKKIRPEVYFTILLGFQHADDASFFALKFKGFKYE